MDDSPALWPMQGAYAAPIAGGEAAIRSRGAKIRLRIFWENLYL